MSTHEQDHVLQILKDLHEAERNGKKLRYESWDGRIHAVSTDDPDRNSVDITPQHLGFGGKEDDSLCIVVSAEAMEGGDAIVPSRFWCLDGGRTYSALGDREGNGMPGTICVTNRPVAGIQVASIGAPEDHVRVILRKGPAQSGSMGPDDNRCSRWEAIGFLRSGNGQWEQQPVMVVSLREDLFARARGVFETDVLSPTCVFTAGVGSIGSYGALELCKSGVCNHIVMDDDRIEVPNVIRHVAGTDDVGRLKVHVVADEIRRKNPLARVVTCAQRITWASQDLVRSFVRRSDLVICGADDDEARVILNKICVEENKPVIFPGALRRAYGGQVLLVRPGKGPCYQCFLRYLPEQARDREISSQEDAERFAYSDRPFVAEPGLSNDIVPIPQMGVKLAIQQLMQGTPSALRTLDADLVAPLYIWISRREAGTDFEELQPLEFNVDGFHVMRWYGVDLPRDQACPCCGEVPVFTAPAAHVAAREGDARVPNAS
ncbi:MAG: ThiF family adenylyltransferase [Planctomycetota bacterium]|nr:ThiF family adenylyltransferase [Planctomycetota bacterium]